MTNSNTYIVLSKLHVCLDDIVEEFPETSEREIELALLTILKGIKERQIRND